MRASLTSPEAAVSAASGVLPRVVVVGTGLSPAEVSEIVARAGSIDSEASKSITYAAASPTPFPPTSRLLVVHELSAADATLPAEAVVPGALNAALLTSLRPASVGTADSLAAHNRALVAWYGDDMQRQRNSAWTLIDDWAQGRLTAPLVVPCGSSLDVASLCVAGVRWAAGGPQSARVTLAIHRTSPRGSTNDLMAALEADAGGGTAAAPAPSSESFADLTTVTAPCAGRVLLHLPASNAAPFISTLHPTMPRDEAMLLDADAAGRVSVMSTVSADGAPSSPAPSAGGAGGVSVGEWRETVPAYVSIYAGATASEGGEGVVRLARDAHGRWEVVPALDHDAGVGGGGGGRDATASAMSL